MEREIVVRGQGELRVLPDRAVFQIGVETDGSSREDAYQAAQRLTSAVDLVLADMSEVTARVVTTALAVQPRTRWRKGESVPVGWRASRTSSVEVVDLARVDEFVAAVAGAGASVLGPTWVLDAIHPAWNQVRRLAAEDARRRAEAYAEALQVTLGTVMWIAEPGLRLARGDMAPRMFAASSTAALGSLGEQPIEVDIAELTLTAAVEVGFALA